MFGLDFETFGSRNINNVGLDNYVNDPLFTPLLACAVEKDVLGVPQFYYFELIRGQHVVDEFIEFLRDRNSDWHMRPTAAAHNAGFERAVIKHIVPGLADYDILCTASLARQLGAGGKLEAAGPQLLNVDKLEDGKRLIQKFCVGDTPPGPEICDDPEWPLFVEYCRIDALLSLELAELGFDIPEHRYEQLTHRMNERGWFVDLDDVQQMRVIEEHNKEEALQWFRDKHDPKETLNLNSFPQLKAWTKDRGVAASSFSEDNVEKLLRRVSARMASHGATEKLQAVHDMLVTKQVLGGSSLKKLPVFQAYTSVVDSRLRDQYVHAGAGATFRTSGRAVQLQNLKRLTQPKDMELLYTDPDGWTNDDLAVNLRQVLRAEHPEGRLIVGDFSSVESRGLAYLANEQWKIDEYHQGKDMYKVLAAKQYGIEYEQVDKQQRTFGKVGELSCGYGAGGSAVKDFAAKMHVELTDEEAQHLVNDWRAVNPNIVAFWGKLDDALKDVVDRYGAHVVHAGHGISIQFQTKPALPSITAIHPGAKDLLILLYDYNGNLISYRWVRGIYRRGEEVCYYKPSERKGGALWNRDFVHPKTKRRTFYKMYGGKLAGILTQSFCREIFFQTLSSVERAFLFVPNVQLIGQFHDEMVLEWSPSEDSDAVSLDSAVDVLRNQMSFTSLPDFPLAAEVAHAHRYIK